MCLANEQLHGFICTWTHNLMEVFKVCYLLHVYVVTVQEIDIKWYIDTLCYREQILISFLIAHIFFLLICTLHVTRNDFSLLSI